MLLRRSYFRQWTDGGLLPLLWDGGGGEGEIKEASNWPAEHWSSQPEKPCWELVEARGCGMEVVEGIDAIWKI